MANKPNTVVVRFSLGRNSGSFDGSTTEGAQRFASAIADAVADKTTQLSSDRVKLRVRGLSSRLGTIAEAEYEKAIKYALTNMVGARSQGASPIVFELRQSFGEVPQQFFTQFKSSGFVKRGTESQRISWAPLTKATLQRKAGGALHADNLSNASRFFIDHGDLLSEMKTKAAKMVKKAARVKVTVIDNKDFKVTKAGLRRAIPASNLRITLLPNIYPGYLPGIRTGNIADVDPTMRFEKALGLSDKAVEKLKGFAPAGVPLKQRPLLQPVFTFWTLYRIPNRIATALVKSIAAVKQSGIEDNSVAG